MHKFRFRKIDAFATINSDGNPAGYIHLDSMQDITEAQMQQIARELKGFVNEAGFFACKSDRLFSLKFYSSEREVDFCGHATIAIMYDLVSNNESLQKYDTLEIETNRGRLSVTNRISAENAVYIMSPVPFDKAPIPDVAQIAGALRISRDSIADSAPLSIINAGLSTLIVPIKGIRKITGISPVLEELKKFCIDNGIDIIEVFTDEVSNASNDFRTRVFAPTFGYLEDPATGSGNSAFGYYLQRNGRFTRDTVTIEQNGDLNRYNIVKLRKQTDTENNIRILFGGGAVTRIEGTYILQ